jgi:ferritin
VIESLGLLQGIENSLLTKINNAADSSSHENDGAAINLLQAFINEVEAQKGKRISEEDADLLIAYANHVIAQI